MISTATELNTEIVVNLTSGPHKHRHSAKDNGGFLPPDGAIALTFTPLALCAAAARAHTTASAPSHLLAALAASTLAPLRQLIQGGPDFSLSSDIGSLADAERTLFGARTGAGVAHLYMEALGYAWRANGASLSKANEPHPDLIYEDGCTSGLGVVVTEAHGSFSAKTSASSIKTKAKAKYNRQVRPYVGTSSPHGQVLHGYSVAFGAKPGSTGSFLSISETHFPKAKKSPSPSPPKTPLQPSGSPRTDIALSTYRSNFLLMGALDIVEWIDWTRGARDQIPDKQPIPLLSLTYAGRRFLGYPGFPDAFWRWRRRMFRHDMGLHADPIRGLVSPDLNSDGCWFVMEETRCKTFLNVLSEIVQADGADLSARLVLGQSAPVGFSVSGGEPQDAAAHDDYHFALFRDGLALLSNLDSEMLGRLVFWAPDEGMSHS